jgi:putative endonuclease
MSDRSSPLNWHVYIILCSDDTLYTGITTDIERRMRQHALGQGAKYFRGRRPERLLYLEGGHDRSSASKRELSIKKMKRSEKQQLVESQSSTPPVRKKEGEALIASPC